MEKMVMVPIRVRDGKRVVPTCPECGCRLEKISNVYQGLAHFYGTPEKDARGHKCSRYEDIFPKIIGA